MWGLQQEAEKWVRTAVRVRWTFEKLEESKINKDMMGVWKKESWLCLNTWWNAFITVECKKCTLETQQL